MRLVEGVGSKLLPVGPYLFQYLGVVSVLLSAGDEFGFHVVQLVAQLLTHGLTQGIRFASGKVGQQTRKKHDLLLVDGDAVRILQVLFHDRYIVLDGLASLLTVDEVGDVVHRSRSVEGVHGNQVLESAGLQLAQVLLHTGRFKLEGSDGTSVAVEFISGRVADGNLVDVEVKSSVLAYVFHGFLEDGQCLQPQEVHLDKSRVFDDRTFVLGDEHLLTSLLVVGGAHGHPVGNVVAADNGTAGMYTRTAYVAFEHLGILQRIANQRVGRGFGGLQLGHVFYGVGQVELFVGYLVGYELGQTVGFGKRQLFHTGHVLDNQFGGHCTVGNDVCHFLLSVFLGYPAQHLSAAIIIEVHIDIGEGDTVRVQETLEQQVVLNGVNLGNAQAVGNGRTGGRTTSGAYPYAQFGAGGIDEVLHDEEVAREPHGLHDVELELESFLHFFIERVAVKSFGTVEGQFGQIVGFQLDTVELVISAQTLDFGFGGFLVEHYVAVFVLCKLVEKVFLGQALAIFGFRTKLFGDGKGRHDGRMVDGIVFHLVQHLQCVGQCFGNVGKQLVHFGFCLHPFLFGIKHALGVVQVFAGAEANQTVVCLGVLFVYKVDVVGTYYLDIVFLGQLQHVGIGFLLHGIGFVVGTRHSGFMTLQLQIVVLAKEILVPAHGFLGFFQLVVDNLFGNLATDTGRADNKSLMILLQFAAVGTRAHVVAFGPGMRYELDEVMISFFVLCQYNKVPAALVGFALFLVHAAACHIHFATDDWLEKLGFRLCYFGFAFRNLGFLALFGVAFVFQCGQCFLQVFDFTFRTAVLFIDVVGKFLDAKHVAMVGDGNTLHSVFHGFVHQLADAGLSVEQRVLGVYVQMNKIVHRIIISKRVDKSTTNAVFGKK